jgi:hypothetical protein
MRYENGSVYEGDYKADKKEGHGSFIHCNGDRYDGEWRDGKYEGRGMYTTASGESMVTAYRAGQPVGVGAMWSRDRTRAVRLQDGNAVDEISLDEAREIAEDACNLKPGILLTFRGSADSEQPPTGDRTS